MAIRSVLLFVILGFGSNIFSQPLSFDQALETIISRDPEIMAGHQELKVKGLNIISKKVDFLPDLSASVNHTHNYQNQQDNDSQGISLNSKLNLFKFGGDYANHQAAKYQKLQSTEQLNDLYLAKEAEGVQALLKYLLDKQQSEIYKKQAELLNQSYNLAQVRFKKGLLAAQEVQKISVDFENSKAYYQNALADQGQSQANVIALLGHSDVISNWPWENSFKDAKINQIINKKVDLSERPDWKALLYSVDNQKSLLKKSKAQILPSLDLNVSYGQNKFQAGGDWHESWQGVVGLSLPLFSNLNDYTGFRYQKINVIKAQANLTILKRKALSQSVADRENFKISLKTAKSREKNLEISRRLFKDNYQRFTQGRADANELIIDQRRLLDTENLVLSGWHQAHLHFLKFCHSYGMRVKKCLGL